MATLAIDHFIYRLAIVPYSSGYRVRMMLLPPLEDVWETVWHEELWETVDDAARLLLAIKRHMTIDLSHWVWSTSPPSLVDELQAPPIAKLKVDFFRHAF
jgi:hypothetical protein